ncbi:aminotransferase class I/II-fold pyridoxal phosphate-dependent enzyme [Mucilaginibacter myungsuensis]|uniref:8-amino-7-oxononanoate synthase n=1 Tax=Mucilaginibacter myungsuensis TaxID=649104 RepID=A0A929L2P7_9SPHI|nr:8-amino-7-oxononanoate synthase [Mucilaginibacter myungsuensis]MBE9662131.1 8-amino-7-oxononanoate synthase [Mucilaginibacter myungsuensis]MDN3599435.1 8-amino-7-oxononanoate synthase [Mucilaginibacter myungsuensis]
MRNADQHLQTKLDERKAAGNYRTLKPENALVDFCSNDYLGFARSPEFAKAIASEVSAHPVIMTGSTGSRLLAGNTTYAEDVEKQIAGYQGYPAGLIFNSGYDANVGLFSSVPQKGDTIITDELVHASIIDGCRLSYANRYRFKHNDTDSLIAKLKQATGNIYIAIESIYSMDGDSAPLADIADIAQEYNANLIVDEAHATGVFGKGLVDELGLQERVFAQVVTFGKALGCHGAVVLGNDVLRQYLINFSRSFIYTTAAPFHQVAAAKVAYDLLNSCEDERDALHHNIYLFKQSFANATLQLIPSDSAIQCILLKSNDAAKSLSTELQQAGYDVRPILSPTVAAGTERLRICIHSFNTEAEIIGLSTIINKFTL